MRIDIIFGPPGTGKTTKLLNILEDELRTYAPNEIAYVSFSRKGAYEGRDRAIQKFSSVSESEFKYFKTLHAIAFRELNTGRGMMIGKKHYKQLGEKLGFKFSGFFSEDFQNTKDDAYLMYDILNRNNLSAGNKVLPTLEVQQLRYIQLNYKHFRETLGILDFTDLIEMFVHKNKPLPVKIAIIDEAQDLTSLQWQMVLVAFRDCNHIYIAGDDDQALYQWSGADVKFFLSIQGNQHVLDKSWRLPQQILNYSTQITDLIGFRAPKQFTHKGDKGNIHVMGSIEEIDMSKGEWMIISRNVSYLFKIQDYLRDKSLVFKYKGIPSVNPQHIKAINQYEYNRKHRTYEKMYLLQDVMDPDVKPDYRKPWYNVFNLHENIITYYRDLLRDNIDITNYRIEVNTIHGVKGGEKENVILLLDYSRNVKKNWNEDPDSELRCYYVGVTRSKKNLYIIPTNSQYGYPLLKYQELLNEDSKE